MCDTFFLGPSATQDGKAWFAKNSDRNPAEPQALCIIGPRPRANTVRVGTRVFQRSDLGLPFALSKPSWMAGGEMGINGNGVAIGNEAVFSRFPAMADGVLGMDLLRAALASSATALEAVDFICGFTEENGQGGNGAYKGKLIYSNSYIVSDREEAFVVETAGRRWAWRRIEDLAAISNAYSIEEDYKRLDAQTRKEIAPVNERAACSDEADPGRKGRKESWRAHVERRIYLRFTKGDLRRATVLSRLEAARGRAGFSSILAVLREHGGFNPLWGSRHMEGICMHAGGLLNNATTASMLVAYPARPQDPLLVWFSGTSYPCRSLYKPVLLDDGAFKPLWTEYDYAEDSSASFEYWNRQRAWIRETRSGARIPDAAFVARRDAAQGSIAEAAAAVAAGGNPVPEKARINAAVREWQTALPGRG